MARPSKYKPEFDKQAYKLCLLGATDKQLADFFEVDVDTIKEWKKVHESFSASLKGAKDHADSLVAKSLYKKAVGFKHKEVKIFQYEGSPVVVPYTAYYPPDTTSIIFWLKNRKPEYWRDKQDLEHNMKGDWEITLNVNGENKVHKALDAGVPKTDN